MLRLVKAVAEAAKGDMSFDWLKPFTHTRSYTAGDIVFRKGDVATDMGYVIRGKFRLVELDMELTTGALLGELGLLSPGNVRTQTLECVTGGDMLVISYDEVRQLQVQNPGFALYFLQVATGRLFQNMKAMERELAELRGKGVPAAHGAQ